MPDASLTVKDVNGGVTTKKVTRVFVVSVFVYCRAFHFAEVDVSTGPRARALFGGKMDRQMRMLERAVDIFGSQRKLAKATGFSQYTIWKACNTGIVTPRLATAIERATGGRIRRQHVCSPDRDVFAAA